MVTDPVCGMMVDPAKAPARSTHNGTDYYFCCSACKSTFDQAPARYTGTSGMEDHEAAAPDAGASPGTRVDYFGVSGMHCAACVGRVEKALRAVPGVASASVNLAMEQAEVSYRPDVASPEDLERAVHDAGYQARLLGAAAPAEDAAPQDEAALLRARLVFAITLTLPVCVLEMIFMHWMPGRWVSLVLTTPVVFWAGRGFFSGAAASLRHRSTDMNTLIALGTLSAYVFSLVVTVAPGAFHSQAHPYFETAAVITTLILFGRFLEARARRSASQAVRKLMSLQPPIAHVLRDGAEKEMPVEAVRAGDLIVVRPGERVPVDGEITEGSSALDESMMTGESLPVERGVEDAVMGGCINHSGSFVFRATRVGADTALQQIVRIVRQAQAQKAPVQRLADAVSAWFVPAVVVISAVTFAVWLVTGPGLAQALAAAVSVLIVACPCALGLATPAAIMVGGGRGAEMGILIKGAEVLERAGRIDTVVLDKTGTVTTGEPRMTEIIAEAMPEHELLLLAGAAESRSGHPLGDAVAAAARERGIALPEPEDVQALSGLGLTARVNGHQVLIGNARLFAAQGIPQGALEAASTRLAEQGVTAVLIAVDGRTSGAIGLADRLKPHATESVQALKRLGMNVLMITGDSARTARAVAAEAGIQQVFAETLPSGKAEAVRRLQQDGHVVAMVGDGVNDAPALAQADVGVAIGAGADVALEASDITLIRADLTGVVNAVRLSRRTLSVIRQNLFFAFIYNVIAIPVAAGVLYPLTGWMLNPMIASFTMAMSSVSVVTNSLRLRHFS